MHKSLTAAPPAPAMPWGLLLWALLLAGLLAGPGPAAAQPTLPSLGDRISGTVSLDQEYELGQDFMRNLRRAAPTIPDPLLNAYLESTTFKIAARSQLQDHRLSFVIIDSEDLNAFAAPGGIIGVNAGLFIEAETEGEFASVMAHEIAHLSQRHYARSVDEAQSSRVPQLATMLASVLIMATSDAGHGMAALTAAQGRALENRLRYSRSNESEADRVGQDTMYEAGFDPTAMAGMFEQLMAGSRFDSRPPEYLLSHPVSESRVAESRARAARYTPREYPDDLEYQINRARVLAHYAKDKPALVAEWEQDFEQELEQTLEQDEEHADFKRDVSRYRLAVAYWEAGRYREAQDTLAPLLQKDPNRISYAVTQAEIYNKQREPALAASFLRRHLNINPGNHALTMAYVDAMQEARDYQEAAAVMEQHTERRPNDHHLWYRLAETQGQAGNIRKVHEARAEYFTLVGDFESAAEQWAYALRLAEQERAGRADLVRLRQKIGALEERLDPRKRRR